MILQWHDQLDPKVKNYLLRMQYLYQKATPDFLYCGRHLLFFKGHQLRKNICFDIIIHIKHKDRT
jgi:hypothetical protein